MLVELNKFVEIGVVRLMFFLLEEGFDGVMDEQPLPLLFEELFALGVVFLLLVLGRSLVGVEGNLVLLLVVFDEVGQGVVL